MTWHVELDYQDYETAREEFEWTVPAEYNLAHDLLRKHEDVHRPALHQSYPDGRERTYSFRELDDLSDRVARGLANRGVGRGDRVGVVLPQVPANPLTHLACWKLGAVSIPLSVLFGPDGLESRLGDAGAVAVVADEEVRDAVSTAVGNCRGLDRHVEVRWRGEASEDAPAWNAEDGDDGPDERFATLLGEPAGFDRVETGPDTPAVVLYTSGSTGPPKGVLHTHDVWVGHCPAFFMYVERDVEGTYWTPADWAWIGALGDLLFPAWHYGQPVVGHPMGPFDPETAVELMDEYDVTDAFLPPTAIRMLMSHGTGSVDLSLETVCSGGEPLTPEILEWADDEMDGLVVNELYGQTEANLLVTNCRDWFSGRAGSMGKPVPGHEVAIVDTETGERKPPGEVGAIAVRRADDPVVFSEYWNAPERTAAATLDGWHLTGDLGSRDEDGYLWFKSRDDDVIITAGYRVGPGEVEGAILNHADVEQAGVIGVPDDTRGELIKAFVEPAAGVDPDDELREEIRSLVRDRLAKHEYPREIEFLAGLPQTTTGKIRRRALRDREGSGD
ncbi:acyl-CoA synthetase [Halorarum halobium]|uniref:acyl-CoA synthetase n=1 Tax=Halorarum halobium TaxID=3075121 RepID=UPI0028A9A8B4|nr:AMP-binding protein [Halobaculum sp. XH14]